MVAENFGKDAGDTVIYRARLEQPFSNATPFWRFQMSEGENVAFQMGGVVQREIIFHGNDKFVTMTVPLGKLKAGECELRFTSAGGATPL